MPLLATFIGNLFAGLVSFLAAFITKKTALGLAALSVFGSLTVALMVAMSTSINAVLHTFTLPSWFLVGFSLFLPSNFVAGVSAIVAGHAAVAVYRWNVTNLRLVSQVT